MKKASVALLIILLLTLNWAALDDITTGSEPNLTGEYAVLALSASLVLSAMLYFKKQVFQKNIQLLVLPTILFAGTVFAFTVIIDEFVTFYNLYGTIFRIKDCVIPNPATTACFYGAFAFLAATIYSLKIVFFQGAKQKLHSKYLLFFLIGSNVFAWFNTARVFYKFYTPTDKIGCGGQIITNPFDTACFYGASIFLLALIAHKLLFTSQKNTKGGEKK